jgi:hypothetical protein
MRAWSERTTTTTYLPNATFAALSKLFWAFVYIGLTFAPAILNFTATMEQFADPEFNASVPYMRLIFFNRTSI